MTELMDNAMSEEIYWELEKEGRSDKKERRKERYAKRPPASVSDQKGALNTAELKKRIYNRHVSKENVIKALEALPPSERKSTIASLPPGLKRKLGSYLTDDKHWQSADVI